ncbi:ribbon-helix-helix protein, CopG family [Kosakonia radicincitans]|uniref:CopG family ribbon-helix-helix protein n=1 Tax=Kosakonia radicincitans TaxID=283686 RepID=UPI0009041FE8|nr:CopG family ribbon-helix-helix protein [Kosakonia radicincitans]APG17137.1 CopG family transcriptional regulator [Kosakonia radicincitans]QEM92589.1 ribbon-helix-helix protein, CopG family [Kosakonia radicincitans]VVT48211.1 hypothetical protein UYSO10_2142 [Kosakonia radicincitans]
MSGTKVLTAHVPIELADKVDLLAESSERSRGWIIKRALAEYIERAELRQAMIQQGLDAVERGETVSHAEAATWLKSLGTVNPMPLPGVKKRG